MRSVVTAGDALQLVELKAVAAGYPLRGEVLVADEAFADPRTASAIPGRGTVWVESRLLSLVGIDVGDTLTVGAQAFEVAAILVLEPDRGGDLFNIAPRVMMNAADLAGTGLIAAGSRVRYGWLVAGEQAAVDGFQRSLELQPGERLLSPKTARPEIRSALQRAEQYLGLATLTTILLAGVAIALAARSFAAQHKDTVALLRTLGASRRYVLAHFTLEILLLGVLTAAIGAGLGMAAQEFIARSMSGWLQTKLPPPALGTAVRAAATALVALTGFALPPLLNLRDVPPVRVLRSDADANAISPFSVVAYALAAGIFVAPWGNGDPKITGWALVGMGVGLAALIVTALILIKVIASLRSRSGLVWRFGVANVARRGILTIVQITALGLSLLALLVLSIIRNDLLDSWVSSLPPDAPNQFLINIQPADVTGLQTFFRERQLPAPAFYPMVRGRLTGLNGARVSPESYPDPRARRLAEREFNLSFAAELKPYNKLVAGRWWTDTPNAAEFSVEQDIANTLGISLGDSLTYQIAEREVNGTVTNLRAVQWDSMRVNFFVEAPPALLADYPATYITSFRLDAGNYPLLKDLVTAYPSVTVIDIAALVDHVRTIMDRSAATIEFVFAFTLLAGILVLVAAVQATQDERVFESALLKTFGASRALTLRIMGAEFCAIGAIAGAVAGVIALFSSWLVATRVLELDYSPDPSVILVGVAAGLLSVGLVGSVAVANALRRPAAVVLRYGG
jgi:putative ABC transport system permease protein